MSINIIEANMDNNNADVNMEDNNFNNEKISKYHNKERNFIITDKSLQEDFEDKDYYDMYVKNQDFNIMEMAEILSTFPEFLYSIIQEFSNEDKKEIRGYNEYKEYVKNHNKLCREIYKKKNKENEMDSEINICYEQIQMLNDQIQFYSEEKQIAKNEKK